MTARWADLFGADPNFTLGMDASRYLTHNRGECPDDIPCALCLLESAEADLRVRLTVAIEDSLRPVPATGTGLGWNQAIRHAARITADTTGDRS